MPYAGGLALRSWGAQGTVLLIGAPKTTVSDADPGRAQSVFSSDLLRAGVPWMSAATSAQFVPQSLNLDLISGVAYDKGCYVGQEVVARARRAGVQKRAFLFRAACAAPPDGTAVLRGEEEVGTLLHAEDTGNGCLFLAVVPLDAHAGGLTLGCASAPQLIPAVMPYAVPAQKA
jgi:folate-binding protein YgfZ